MKCCCSRKAATYITVVMFFMLNGIEYAVIFPTLWLYIHETFHAPGYMMGIVVAAFSVSGIIAGPLIGRWADATHNTKYILLFANLWEIAGNIMYMMGLSTWFIVAARLVCGIGAGAGSAVIADISRGTTEAERTSVLSKIMAARQFGLFIGPAFNFFLRTFDFYIGSYHINAYTAPGLFLAVLWSLQELQVMLMYFNLEELHVQEKLEATAADIDYTLTDSSEPHNSPPTEPLLSSPFYNNAGPSYGSVNTKEEYISPEKVFPGAGARTTITSDLTFSTSGDESDSVAAVDALYSNSLTDSSRHIESAERYINTGVAIAAVTAGNTAPLLAANGNLPQKTQLYGRDTTDAASENRVRELPEAVANESSSSLWRQYVNEYFREEIVLLLFLLFITFFNQVALETILTPLTKKYFDWAELENSILYSSCAVELLVVFAVVSRASRVVSDRTIITFGILAELAGMAWNLAFIPSAQPGDEYIMLYFIVGVVLLLAGLPCLATAAVSLYSKLTSHHLQGFSHGFRRSMVNIAFIIGPLWGGGMLGDLWWLFAVNTALITLVLFMTLLSYKRLVIRNTESDYSTFSVSTSTQT